MTTFEQYLENLMGMKKAEIINEGITWGIWANTEGNKALVFFIWHYAHNSVENFVYFAY